MSMVENTVVARPYAEAIFRLAHQQGLLKEWDIVLQRMENVISDPEIAAVVAHPNVRAEQIEALLGHLLLAESSIKEEVSVFIHLLMRHHRLFSVSAIRKQFILLRDQSKGWVAATVISAFPLSDPQLAALNTALAKRLGQKIYFRVEIDRALLAGAKIVIGDQVIDGSIKGKLEQLAHQLNIQRAA